jgi:hypothetical protein
MRKRIAAILATCALSVGVGADVAAAQPEQNGLVNVAIGDITIQDIGVGVAANILANVCGVQVNAAVIAEQVVRNNEPLVRTCEAVAGDPTVTITQ